MDFKPVYFLSLSKYLVKIAEQSGLNSESVYRAAIGRAYYASFLKAREYALEIWVLPNQKPEKTIPFWRHVIKNQTRIPRKPLAKIYPN
ncbi:hypothetical protein [Methanolapillus ohkumae]|uniref:Uncharacterized protein n=1 Tax=Methanolapillus ohkumae TaxID=3028298 RepID=A0AA96ZV30_9EURY|nr:hypothetical protein MsAm2_01660 [Methanosarcinaceae archaeon Am2]